MAKEAYYFSHDSNARNDDKIIALRMKLGWEGYGLYWAIIERLRDNSEYTCVKDYNIIAFDLRTDAAKIKSIVEEFGLFAFTEDGKCFYSESLNKRMGLKNDLSKKRSEAATKRWKKNPVKPKDECKTYANAMQVHSKCNAIKEKEINIPPIPPFGESVGDSFDPNENLIPDWPRFINQFNEITGKKINVLMPHVKAQIINLLTNGYSKYDLIKVFEKATKDKWIKENSRMLHPEYLTRPEIFPKYADS